MRILAFLALLYLANLLTHQIVVALNFELRPSNEDFIHRMLMVSALLYTLLLAIPFVPGVEIGITMLAALGPPIAFLVYLCTVAALMISFMIGRLVPIGVLRKLAELVKLDRLCRLLGEIEPLEPRDRVAYLAGRGQFSSALARYRYLALAAFLNLPGNFLVGGGGGIGLVAGMSGLFSTTGYLATVMIAVSPVPIAVSLFGTDVLG